MKKNENDLSWLQIKGETRTPQQVITTTEMLRQARSSMGNLVVNSWGCV